MKRDQLSREPAKEHRRRMEMILRSCTCLGGRSCPPLIPAILQELGVEALPVESHQGANMDPVLLGLAGPPVAFPFHFSASDILFREWDTPELGLKVSKAMDKLYPLPEEVLELLRLPRVDAAVSAVTKRSTIPVTGATALKDIQDRKLEVQLKKVFEVSALGVRAAICSNFVLRAGLRWAQNLQANAGLSDGESSQADHLEAVIAYSADAMHDLLRTSARAMVSAVSAHRLLWLRNWAADGSSKAHLGSLPFKGKLLFGKQLDDLMQFLGENKAFKLPEDRPRPRTSFSARSRFRGNRRQQPQRSSGSGPSYRSGSTRSSSWSVLSREEVREVWRCLVGTGSQVGPMMRGWSIPRCSLWISCQTWERG
ncbi:lamina-associated polypeptide 2, isoforms alpha/zeta-like [Rhinatrema bivittatum]|uniref:lamina-associated polypeptide 2, isoforms alpha/zeta-like n=1 Tax=Rhinatrema bivittatum TaxID=194408 RepID=UPI0011275E6E|nr:lamina-associated polypeptide 2, isoforms alpha/zeta-like [Rhinatrema bivittatum]